MKYLVPFIIAAACILLITNHVTLFALVLVALVWANFYASRYLYGNLFSPLAVFSIGWLLPASCVVFLPNHIKFDGWEVHQELWLAIILSYLAFLAGHLFTLFFIDNGRAVSGRNNPSRKYYLQRGWESFPGEKTWNLWLIRAFFMLGMIGFTLNINNVIQAGGFSLYRDLGFRDVETIFGQSTLVNYLYFLLPLVLLIGMIHQCRFGYTRSITLLMTLSFIGLFFHGTKSTIVFPVVIALIAFFYSRRSVRPKMVFITLGLLLICFQIITIGRNLPYMLARDEDLFTILTVRLDDLFLYFSPGFANLQEEILNLKNFRGGVESFQFAGELVNFILGKREGITQTVFEGEQFYMFNDAYNTGTFLREHYRDFGFVGVAAFSFVYGLISNLFYCRFLEETSIRNVALYSIISLMLLISFFSNHYFKIQYWYWIFVITIADVVARLVMQKRNQKKSRSESVYET